MKSEEVRFIILDFYPSLSRRIEYLFKELFPGHEVLLYTNILSALPDLENGKTKNCLILSGVNHCDELKRILLLKELPHSHLFLVGSSKVPNPDLEGSFFISEKRLTSSLVPEVVKVFSLKPGLRPLENVYKLPGDDLYFPVRLEKILSLKKAPCDLFVQISEKKIQKVIHKNTIILEVDLEVIKKNKITELQVRSNDFFFYDHLFNPSFDKESFLGKDLGDSGNDNVEMIKDTIREIGFSKIVVESVADSFDKISQVKGSYELKKALRNFDPSDSSFLYNHSFLTAIMCISFLKAQTWNNSKIEKKILMACFFHDLGFTEGNNSYLELSYDEISSGEKLSGELREEMTHHMDIVADKLLKNMNIDEDTIKIIKTHHYSKSVIETSSGVSFTLLCLVFFLSHKLSLDLYKASFLMAKRKGILNELSVYFQNGRYQKVTSEFCREMNKLIL